MRYFSRFLIVLCVFVLAGCNEESSYGGGMQLAEADMEMNLVGQSNVMSKRGASAAPPSQMALDRSKFNNRRIAETHDLNVETEPDDLKARYDRDFKKCLELGCEVTTSNAQARRSAYINARIAPEKLGAYLDFLGTGPGEMKEHSVHADDKTLQYIDTDAKIKNLEQLRERLIRLMNSEKAKDVNQILQIERELNRVEQQLDSAKGTLRHLETITGKATVNSSYSVPYQDFEIRYYEFKNSFKRGYQEMLNSVSHVVRFVGGVLPWIPVWVVGFWIFVKAIKFTFGKGFSLMLWKKNEKSKAKATKK